MFLIHCLLAMKIVKSRVSKFSFCNSSLFDVVQYVVNHYVTNSVRILLYHSEISAIASIAYTTIHPSPSMVIISLPLGFSDVLGSIK